MHGLFTPTDDTSGIALRAVVLGPNGVENSRQSDRLSSTAQGMSDADNSDDLKYRLRKITTELVSRPELLDPQYILDSVSLTDSIGGRVLTLDTDTFGNIKSDIKETRIRQVRRIAGDSDDHTGEQKASKDTDVGPVKSAEDIVPELARARASLIGDVIGQTQRGLVERIEAESRRRYDSHEKTRAPRRGTTDGTTSRLEKKGARQRDVSHGLGAFYDKTLEQKTLARQAGTKQDTTRELGAFIGKSLSEDMRNLTATVERASKQREASKLVAEERIQEEQREGEASKSDSDETVRNTKRVLTAFLGKSLEQDLGKLEETVQRESARRGGPTLENIQELEEKYKKEIADKDSALLEAQTDKLIADVQLYESNERTKTAQAEHAADLEQLRQKHDLELKKLGKDYEALADNLTERAEQKHGNFLFSQAHTGTATAQAEHAADLEQLRQKHDLELKKLGKDYEALADNLTERAEQKHGNFLFSQAHTGTATAQAEHAAALDRLEQEHAVALEKMKKEQAETAQAEHAAALDRLEQEHAVALEKMKKEQAETAQAEQAAALDVLKQQHAAALEQLAKEQAATAEAEQAAALDRLEQEHAALAEQARRSETEAEEALASAALKQAEQAAALDRSEQEHAALADYTQRFKTEFLAEARAALEKVNEVSGKQEAKLRSAIVQLQQEKAKSIAQLEEAHAALARQGKVIQAGEMHAEDQKKTIAELRSSVRAANIENEATSRRNRNLEDELHRGKSEQIDAMVVTQNQDDIIQHLREQLERVQEQLQGVHEEFDSVTHGENPVVVYAVDDDPILEDDNETVDLEAYQWLVFDQEVREGDMTDITEQQFEETAARDIFTGFSIDLDFGKYLRLIGKRKINFTTDGFGDYTTMVERYHHHYLFRIAEFLEIHKPQNFADMTVSWLPYVIAEAKCLVIDTGFVSMPIDEIGGVQSTFGDETAERVLACRLMDDMVFGTQYKRYWPFLRSRLAKDIQDYVRGADVSILMMPGDEAQALSTFDDVLSHLGGDSSSESDGT